MFWGNPLCKGYLKMRLLLRFLAIPICLIFLSLDLQASKVGEVAKDFSLKEISGREISPSHFRDKILILHFWALWCGSCREELPSLDSLYRAYRERGLEVLTISTDTSITLLKEFVIQKGLSLPILLDTDKKVTVGMYGVIGIPVTFIIGRDGRVHEKIQGARDWDNPKMRKRIEALLKGQKMSGH